MPRAPRWSPDPDRFEIAARAAIEADPRIWRLFVLELLSQGSEPGRKRLSAKLAIENVRATLRTKLNNTNTAELARAFIRAYPELHDLVETRGKPVLLPRCA